MRKLIDVKNALAANELLSIAATVYIKGGDGGDATDDEKRRQRPGGGMSTNRPSPGQGANGDFGR